MAFSFQSDVKFAYLDDGQRQEDQIPVPRAKKKDNRREVTYEVFAHEIWPRIVKKAKVDCKEYLRLLWSELYIHAWVWA